MTRQIIKAQGGTSLQDKLNKFKQELRDRGVKEGSVEWSREIQNFHRNGRTHSFHGQDYNYNAKRKKATGPKKAADKDIAAKLMSMYDQYASSGSVNVDLAKQIQQALVDSGYDISFRDRHTGKMRTGADAIDGRIGNSTLNALDQYISTANLQSDLYDRDFKEFYGDKSPTYNNVAGRSREQAENYLRTLYQYYADNPAMYKNMMEDPRYNSQLAFLTDEAKSMLYDKYIKNATLQDGDITRQQDLSTLARKGLAGSAGTRDLQHWEAENVRQANSRIGGNILNEVTKPLTAGQMLAGQVAALFSPDKEWEKGGLNYTYTWNPVTGQMQKVAVSDDMTNVSDVMEIENPYAAFAVNTLTDPLFWLGMHPISNAKSFGRNFRTSLKYGAQPYEGVPLVTAEAGETIVPGGNVWTAQPGSVSTAAGGTAAGMEAPGWVARFTNPEAQGLQQVGRTAGRSATRTGRGQTVVGTKTNPRSARGGAYRKGTQPQPRQFNDAGGTENGWELAPTRSTEPVWSPYTRPTPFVAPPQAYWTPQGRPYYFEEVPGGDYTWNYNNMPDGSRRMDVLNGAYPANGDWNPEVLTNMPTAFSPNVWRGFQTGTQQQHGLGTMYYNGLLHGKSKKKKNK